MSELDGCPLPARYKGEGIFWPQSGLWQALAAHLVPREESRAVPSRF